MRQVSAYWNRTFCMFWITLSVIKWEWGCWERRELRLSLCTVLISVLECGEKWKQKATFVRSRKCRFSILLPAGFTKASFIVVRSRKCKSSVHLWVENRGRTSKRNGPITYCSTRIHRRIVTVNHSAAGTLCCFCFDIQIQWNILITSQIAHFLLNISPTLVLFAFYRCVTHQRRIFLILNLAWCDSLVRKHLSILFRVIWRSAFRTYQVISKINILKATHLDFAVLFMHQATRTRDLIIVTHFFSLSRSLIGSAHLTKMSTPPRSLPRVCLQYLACRVWPSEARILSLIK